MFPSIIPYYGYGKQEVEDIPNAYIEMLASTIIDACDRKKDAIQKKVEEDRESYLAKYQSVIERKWFRKEVIRFKTFQEAYDYQKSKAEKKGLFGGINYMMDNANLFYKLPDNLSKLRSACWSAIECNGEEASIFIRHDLLSELSKWIIDE